MPPAKPMLFVRALCVAASTCAPVAAFAQDGAPPNCRDDDKACATKAVKNHVVKSMAYWQHAFARPVDERIGPVPPEVVDFLKLQNIADGFPEKPHAAPIAADFLRDLRAALAELPDPVKRRLNAKLAGIYLVDDLGGTGFTDQVYDARATAVAGYVVLDMAVLNRHIANSWATWKENTPFKAQPGFRLAVEIETGANNDRKNAIQYILLHELGHVLAIGENIHPSWDVKPQDVRSLSAFPFAHASWTVKGDRYASRFDAAFPQRRKVVFYLEPKLQAGQMPATYGNLARTNFSTLYAATSPGDDFAEAFANYVHTVLMKKPFAIRIYRDGTLVKTYRPCWEQARCAFKRKLLEQFLAVP